jgi:glycosyltransferase involved in cell wall biosynthesis
MNKVSVSAVIPCYRCADTISRAVNSVASQTVCPSELILVDDGSKDNTQAVLKNLQDLYGKDWIKILSMDRNYGVSNARNAGWDIATSDYIAFLDADDAWHPDKIAIQYSWMSKNPQIVISGHKCLIVNPKCSLTFPTLDVQFSVHNITKNHLLLTNPFVTPSFMLKRELKYRFDPLKRYAEDFFFLQEVGMDGHIIVILNLVLVHVFKELGVSGSSSNLWRMRSGDIMNYWSLWQSQRINMFTMAVLVFFSIFKFIMLLLFGNKAHFALNRLLTKTLRTCLS